MKSKGGHDDFTFANSSPNRTGMSTKLKLGTKNKENGFDSNNENGVFAQYKKYDNQFEIDVIYTI